ncbi:hypothetical protein N1031_12145 [Herbiconiux moechotypicola]|uniref:Tetratricopeptide repeat protein n=1 Tax=Herbiconiux moechotypicola TaxID=637393 RepID=A0ABP5QPN3_9MICO|nr:hypothetical protein [Herbiconiux moechotypicola]MCS5730514.1 hypothetical protein [Herbiconiux moechotypicola]
MRFGFAERVSPSNAGALGTLNRTPRPLEHQLSIITGYDTATLRETIDEGAVSARLRELGQLRSLSALNEKVVLLRVSGRVDEAWPIANEALRQARFSGDREMALGARIRRAQVQQYQGKLAAALQELGLCVEEAQTHEWGTLEAAATFARGRVLFDLGDFDGALVDFKSTVFAMERQGASLDQLEGPLMGVAAAEAAGGVGGSAVGGHRPVDGASGHRGGPGSGSASTD